VRISTDSELMLSWVRTSLSGQVFVAGAVTLLALTLLTLLDIRRGFLFRTIQYERFSVYSPIHGAMLAAGLGGMLACYRGAKNREPSVPVTHPWLDWPS
jgi:hypothetical protein